MKVLRAPLVIAALVLPAGPAMADYLIECASGGYKYTYCPADTRFGAELAEQKSTMPCTFNESWGYDAGGVWTDGGCRGVFRIREGRAAPPHAETEPGEADDILAEVIADGTMADLQADDEYQGRRPGYGSADAVVACALEAEARETGRGARSIYFESVDQVMPRARRAFDVEFTMVAEYPRRAARRVSGSCRVESGRVTAYSRY